MVGSDFGVNCMDPSCLVTFLAAGDGVMVWWILSLSLLLPIERCLNVTAYLSIIADHLHLFRTTVFPSYDTNSSRINCYVTKLKSSLTGFMNMTMGLLYSNVLHSLQQLSDAFMSIWTTIYGECWIMAWRIRAVLKVQKINTHIYIYIYTHTHTLWNNIAISNISFLF